MKRVLVTGANGFIGRHLIERLLRDGFVVRALVRDGSRRLDWHQDVEVAEGDVQDAPAMEAATAGVDTVFHLAGKVHALSEVQGDEAGYRSITFEDALPEIIDWYRKGRG